MLSGSFTPKQVIPYSYRTLLDLIPYSYRTLLDT